MHITKLTKTDWLVVLQLELRRNTIILKGFITKVPELNQRNKFVCVAMCSLVMSLCSHNVITIH